LLFVVELLLAVRRSRSASFQFVSVGSCQLSVGSWQLTEEMGPVLPEHLLKDVACGAQQRNLGPKLSQFVAMLYLNREYV
jgi:hypothetical protein